MRPPKTPPMMAPVFGEPDDVFSLLACGAEIWVWAGIKEAVFSWAGGITISDVAPAALPLDGKADGRVAASADEATGTACVVVLAAATVGLMPDEEAATVNAVSVSCAAKGWTAPAPVAVLVVVDADGVAVLACTFSACTIVVLNGACDVAEFDSCGSTVHSAYNVLTGFEVVSHLASSMVRVTHAVVGPARLVLWYVDHVHSSASSSEVSPGSRVGVLVEAESVVVAFSAATRPVRCGGPPLPCWCMSERAEPAQAVNPFHPCSHLLRSPGRCRA